MWLPTPIYERIPQFWLVVGLLFIAGGLYLGFEFPLAFWYIGIGFVSWMYGVGICVGIFLARLRHRQYPPTAEQTATFVQ